jgi:hypothetical protein
MPGLRKLTVVAAVLASPSGAWADMTGNDLKGYCASYPQVNQQTAACMGYIVGSLDMARGLNKVLKGGIVCEPPGVTGDQLVSMVVKYLSDHPADLHFSAASLIFNMYTGAFPCAQKPK